jgi:hypothetical protein
MTSERDRLVCARADSPKFVAGSMFGLFCADCGVEVMVAPSGQALLADRDLRITCYECFKKLRRDEYRIEFAQSAARVFAELAATTANPRRKHGAD